MSENSFFFSSSEELWKSGMKNIFPVRLLIVDITGAKYTNVTLDRIRRGENSE